MQKPKGFEDIPSWEGSYAISRDGQIYSYPNRKKTTGRFLKLGKTTTGYYKALLVNKPRREDAKVHRLVALTFIPNPENKRCVNHKNHNPLDNRVENLEWCTHQENARYRKFSTKKNKTSKYKGVRKSGKKYQATIVISRDKPLVIIGSFDSEIEAAIAYNKKAKELFGSFAYLNKFIF